jgi:hypothetical protein
VTRRALAAAAAFLAACSSLPQQGAKPSNELERALYFVEAPRAGGKRAISGDSVELGAKVTKVVPRAEVDVNSRIDVRVSQEELVGGSGSQVSRERMAELEGHRDRLTHVLAAYAEWLAARPAVLEAYARVLELPVEDAADREHPTWKAFESAQLAQSQRFRVFSRVLIEQYAARDPEIAAALDEISDSSTLAGLHELVSGLVERFQGEIDAEIAARDAALRLEAFVLADGKDPEAIHLEGYDRLDQKRVEIDSARAFDVSAEDLAAIVSMTVDVANAAKKVDEENADYLEAFGAISPRIAARLGELDARVRELAAALDADALRQRLESTRAAIQSFADAAVDAARDEEREAAAAARRRLQDAFDDVRRLLEDGRSIARELRALRESFGQRRPADLLAAVRRAADLQPRIAEWLRALDGVAGTSQAREALAKRATDALGEALASLDADVRARWAAAWEASDAKRELEGWAQLFESARQLAREARAILGIAGGAALPEDARVAEAIEVPIAEVQDTWIDLRRTGRKVGDAVVLRATLSEKGEVVRTSDFEFDVVRHGYHDALVPSVVLVRPDRLAGAAEDFEFAPSLTWAHAYYPRPEESGWFDRFCRTMRPSLGVHAILLDFDDDQATEIGLGGTFAIWGDRLQLGAGVNLMAEGDDEGRYYYFIGSSLIPLLQALERDGGSP